MKRFTFVSVRERVTDKDALQQEIIHKLMAQLLRKDWFGLLMMVCYWSVVFFGEGKVEFNEVWHD